jgi:hypothetical protein
VRHGTTVPLSSSVKRIDVTLKPMYVSLMTTTRTASPASKCKFQVGQTVEVQRPDFTQPGMPLVWRAGRVVSIDANGKLFDVAIQFAGILDKNGNGLVQRELVGPRGGNNTIRAAA